MWREEVVREENGKKGRKEMRVFRDEDGEVEEDVRGKGISDLLQLAVLLILF